MAANKLISKSYYHGEDKKKKKEMSPSTSATKVADSKMDDMTKLIKTLSAKISRLEMENKHVQDNGYKNPNQFRRPFNPRFFS